MGRAVRRRPLDADLVLEGGGVKGIGLVGAVAALTDAGYTIHRVSGTSAGSIVGALVASGLKGPELKKVALSMQYPRFKDVTALEKVPLVGPAATLMHTNGIYGGDYAHDWIRDQLAERDVHTFADLPYDNKELPPERRYKLVVTVTDVTIGQLVRLPWIMDACTA